YIVTSKPKRISVAAGVVHIIILLWLKIRLLSQLHNVNSYYAQSKIIRYQNCVKAAHDFH
ncbi:MAG: hypothetical protein V4605_10425, partial [Pseudomonadota bacterium]